MGRGRRQRHAGRTSFKNAYATLRRRVRGTKHYGGECFVRGFGLSWQRRQVEAPALELLFAHGEIRDTRRHVDVEHLLVVAAAVRARVRWRGDVFAGGGGCGAHEYDCFWSPGVRRCKMRRVTWQ